MSRLITYFCSFGYSGSHNPDADTMMDRNDAAPNKIAKHYGLELVNKSKSGTNMHQQFASIIKDVDDGFIDTQHDKILVQWTFPGRCFSVDKTKASHSIGGADYSGNNSIQHIKWYYENIYDEELAKGQLLSYANACHDILKGNIYQGFIIGSDELTNCHSTGRLRKVNKCLYDNIMHKINNVSFKKFIVDELKENVHPTDSIYPCNHPTDIGHEYITNHYINKIDACPEFKNYV